MSPDPITAITAWTHRSSNEKIRQYGRGEEPGLREVELYLTEHGIIAKSFPIKGEDGCEVTFRGERKKLKRFGRGSAGRGNRRFVGMGYVSLIWRTDSH
jgi:hypothetical protein